MKSKLLAAALLPFLFFYGQACSRMDAVNKAVNSSTSAITEDPPPATDEPVITKAEATVQVADIVGLRPSLAQVFGIAPVSTSWTFLMSLDGNVTGMSAPMQMGYTSVAGEVCDALIVKEARLPAADRLFFKGINFAAGPTQQTAAGISSAVRSIARAVWMRNERADELLIITNALKVFDGETAPALTNQQMLVLCSAMTASLPATIR